ncbi:hypothetical protein BJ123_1302 [Rhodopseudomonas thermotolerans]|uniref:Uncharacterized protein n=2 Tax=Rhodopseudomonas TaxID=1073 RepID=A0A336JTL5_9BRAD|nr:MULTISPECIES: hypothetical protein [Rhodopseudomonas]RED25769.1 hypothetical protein BJ125_1302 [Rhodopseudomonas pentothenatexigens]REF90398.1 hypothetical protein BJ123_1302 [Rhodopseudomonas thermotolerans]SSW93097.1 hypothetical protein SAMN05892882_1302 [Rhodopseudomonas pentothenatexigens]
MRHLGLKLILFVAVWYELSVEFRISPDAAFLATIGLLVGGWLAMRLAGQAAYLMGPLTSGLLIQVLLWFVLLWWFAPAVFHAIPVVFDLLIVVGLALAGARCRVLFEEEKKRGRKFVPAEHSVAVLLAVFGAMAACMISLRQWGSLWPLVAYVLIPGLPFAFGWRVAPLAAPDRFDAKVGDAGSFRDAGLSEER